jgi:hypothetical protein
LAHPTAASVALQFGLTCGQKLQPNLNDRVATAAPVAGSEKSAVADTLMSRLRSEISNETAARI